ncbi:polysaccharide pyruvyl transferase family protein [Acinetobacter junii]|uniref:polysaccharide pyruvyl transferase family protein n=1 Tax=Acinetobacter junii TaxID=40215 RepID=UPI00384CFF0A
MNVYLVCTSGFPNFGDEVILISWLKKITKIHPKCTIWIDSPNPNNVSFMLEGYNFNVRSINLLWGYCFRNYRNNQKIKKLFRTEEVIDFSTFLKNVEEEIKLIGQDDFFLNDLFNSINIIHILGGGYINSMWPASYGLLVACSELKKKYNMKIVMTGAGLMPAVDKKSIEKYLVVFDFIEVRDNSSSLTYDLSLGYDDAFIMVNNYNNNNNKEIPDVMVCVQSDLIDHGLYNKIISLLRERLKNHKENKLRIGYVEAIPRFDKLAFDSLSDFISEEDFFSAKETIHYGLPVKRNQIWYTTRFHHHLIAASGGASGVTLSLMPNYYDIKQKSLLDLGTGWAYFSIYEQDFLPEATYNESFINIVEGVSEIKGRMVDDIYQELNN